MRLSQRIAGIVPPAACRGYWCTSFGESRSYPPCRRVQSDWGFPRASQVSCMCPSCTVAPVSRERMTSGIHRAARSLRLSACPGWRSQGVCRQACIRCEMGNLRLAPRRGQLGASVGRRYFGHCRRECVVQETGEGAHRQSRICCLSTCLQSSLGAQKTRSDQKEISE